MTALDPDTKLDYFNREIEGVKDFLAHLEEHWKHYPERWARGMRIHYKRRLRGLNAERSKLRRRVKAELAEERKRG